MRAAYLSCLALLMAVSLRRDANAYSYIDEFIFPHAEFSDEHEDKGKERSPLEEEGERAGITHV